MTTVIAAKFAPKERGTLFKPKMVAAILAGEKTQTRRVVKIGSNASFGASTRKHHDHDWNRAEIRPNLMLAFMTEGQVQKPTLHVPFKHKADAWEEDPSDDTVDRVYPHVQAGDLFWLKEAALPDFPREFSHYEWSWAEVP